MTATAHCQICARPIKDKAGVIAHHGYKRPGSGWQTASCMGARHRSYELACDALPRAIESCTAYRDSKINLASGMMANPPATLDATRRDAYGKRGRENIVSRPDDFDPKASVNRGAYRPDTYDHKFAGIVKAACHEALAAEADIKYLTERLAAWVAPTEGAA